MKTTITKLVLGLAVTSLSAVSAVAGDFAYGYGGVKDMRGGYTPIPAPVPIPEYKARWYFRADIGAGYSDPPGTDESGLRYGTSNSPGTTGPNPFGFGGKDAEGGGFTSLLSDDGNDFSSLYSFGIGSYLTSNMRFDFTGEFRSRRLVRDKGSYRYRQFALDGAGGGANVYEAVQTNPGGANNNNVQVNGDVTDEARIRSLLFMANYYYDFQSRYGLRPYLGAGLGLAYTEIDRRYSETQRNCEIALGSVGGGSCLNFTGAARTIEREDKQYDASLAASVMAGVTYKVSDATHVDLNYRYLYIGGKDHSMSISGSLSDVDYGSQHEHYLRAGLRFDIR